MFHLLLYGPDNRHRWLSLCLVLGLFPSMRLFLRIIYNKLNHHELYLIIFLIEGIIENFTFYKLSFLFLNLTLRILARSKLNLYN